MRKSERKIIRFELFKMFEDGYTHEQMEEAVKKWFEEWDTTINDIIEALVDSAWNDTLFKKKLKEMKKVLDSILI